MSAHRLLLGLFACPLAVAACSQNIPAPPPAPIPVPLTVSSAPAAATSPAYTERKVVDNEAVTLWEYTYEPGAEAHHIHQHPRAIYIVEGGTLEMVGPTGQANRMQPSAGVGGWSGPATHTVRNVGGTRVKMLEVEVKTVPRPQ